jgi:hypothetical protein
MSPGNPGASPGGALQQAAQAHGDNRRKAGFDLGDAALHAVAKPASKSAASDARPDC